MTCPTKAYPPQPLPSECITTPPPTPTFPPTESVLCTVAGQEGCPPNMLPPTGSPAPDLAIVGLSLAVVGLALVLIIRIITGRE